MGAGLDKSAAMAASAQAAGRSAAPADDAAGRYRQALDQAAVPAGGPAWLSALRRRALEQARARGLPGRRDENWRYIDLEGWGLRAAEYLAATAEPGPAADLPPLPGWTGARVPFVDGIPVAGSAGAGEACTLATLSSADPGLAARFEPLLGADTGPAGPAAGLEALNAALFDDALLLSVDGDASPLLLDLRTTGRHRLALPRILVDLAEGTQLTLVVRHDGEGEGLVNAVTRIRCGRGSRLRLIRLQAASGDTLQVESTRIELGPEAHADITTVDTGARLCRHDLDVRLAGEGAHCDLHGLFLAGAGAEIDNHTLLDHCVPRTRSLEVFRGIVADRGHGVFNGRIVVHEGAAGTEAALNNRNLLLARTGRVDTKPELEIYNDDVRCSHGATTGQLDPTALFYLRSRGIDAPEARRLLIAAFAREVLESVREKPLRECVDRVLADRMEGLIP